MSDHKGDKQQKTEECRKQCEARKTGIWSSCPNFKYRSDTDMERETYDCERCGACYRLYYEDMA